MGFGAGMTVGWCEVVVVLLRVDESCGDGRFAGASQGWGGAG